MSDKYLVFVSDENGLGHIFTGLIQSAYYAYHTGRTLALDMRRFVYFGRDRHAQFLKQFGWHFPPGLHVITDLVEIDRLVSAPGARTVVPGDVLDISSPFDDRTLIVPAYAPGGRYWPDRRDENAPFQILLKNELAERWELAKQRAGWTGNAIGMHFRAMTGEYVERMNRIVIPDFDTRIDVIRDQYIAKAKALAADAGLDSPSFFVASDDAEFIEYMSIRLNHVLSAGAQIPIRRDQSWLHYLEDNNFDISILSDAVNDLWFLSECDGIVRSPHSGYSTFAILNSQKIQATRIVAVSAPTCAEIFESLDANTAVNWTRAALRLAQEDRNRDAYPYRWHLSALERAGRSEDTHHIRRVADWHWDATYSAAVNVPGEYWNPTDLGGGKINNAIAIMRRIAERLPGNPYILLGYSPRSLAYLLAEAGNSEEAIAVALRAIDLEPSDPYLWRELGALYVRVRNFEGAEQALRHALSLAPHASTLFSDYAICLVALGRKLEAVPMLRVAIALRPERLSPRIELSALLLESGTFDEAQSALTDGLPPDLRAAELQAALSTLYEKAGRMAEATSAIKMACDLEPHLLKWKYRLGELAIATSEFDLAFDVFSEILELSPNSAHANHAISILLQRRGRVDEALLAARHAAEIEPLQSYRFARVGELLLQRGDVHGASDALLKAICLGDKGAVTSYMLSIVYERLNNLEEALAWARQAAETEPTDARWHARLAEIVARMPAALVEQERACLVAPPVAPSQYPERSGVDMAVRLEELVRQAKIARSNREWHKAAEFWGQLRRDFPEESIGYAEGVASLRELCRFEEAEAVIECAASRFHDDAAYLIEAARVPFVQGSWQVASRRWDEVMERFPGESAGYLGKAAVLRALGQVDEAEALIKKAIGLFSTEAGPLIEYAWIAQHKKDWGEAIARWQRVREVYPDYMHAYCGAASSYCEIGGVDEAECLLDEAMIRFPDNATPFADYAELAVRRNHWQQALDRWNEVGRRFPGINDHAHRIHIARMRLLETGQGIGTANNAGSSWNSSLRSDDSTPVPIRDIMLCFESLGGAVGGCEFGGVQRAFGAEPLDLLRWSDMDPAQLSAALDAGFEGVGQPDHTELMLQNNGGRNEYCTQDSRYGMNMHTFIHEDQISFEKMYRQSCQRLQFLAKKIVEDLIGGTKIFVYKTTVKALSELQFDRLASSIARYPAATLLYVRLQDCQHSHGTVEVVRPGVMVGYIDTFSAAAPVGRLTDSSSSWKVICEQAYRLWKSGEAAHGP